MPHLLCKKGPIQGQCFQLDRETDGGPPLVVSEDYAYEARQFHLQEGDCVILFSDGITEAMDVKGRQFDITGVNAVLQGTNAPVREMGERILQAVEAHAIGCSQHDDITLVCFGRTAKA